MTTPLPPEERVGFAVIGLGELTEAELLPAFGLSKRARLRALVTPHRNEAVETALAYGLTAQDAYGTDEFERLAERDDVQAVYIVTPNATHEEYTVGAARMGKHVLCEKPLSHTAESAERMVMACREAGVLLMTAYRCQYVPHHLAARDLVRGGELGRPRLLASVNGQMERDPNAWRLRRDMAGGGPLPDIGLYCLNSTRFLVGTEPTEVFAYQYQPEGDPRFEDVEESISWTMRFPDGVLAMCSASYNVATERTLRVLCEEGSVLLDPAFDYQGLRLEVKRASGREDRRIPEPDQFTLEIDHFAQCIRQGVQPYTPGEEGLQDMRIMEAIYESVRTGRPVKLRAYDGVDVFRGTPPGGDE